MLSPGDPLLVACLAGDLNEHHARRLRGQMLYEEVSSIQSGWSAWRQVQVPTSLLVAEWGMGEGSKPGYSPEAIERLRQEAGAALTIEPLPGADHATAVMSMAGARATAGLIDKSLKPSR
jgi:hypothetical protein